MKSKNNWLIDEIVDSDFFDIRQGGYVYTLRTKNGLCGTEWRRIGCPRSDGYIRFRYKGEFILLHRLIYRKFNGRLVDGLTINHIDRNPSNNNCTNLEQVSLSDNVKHSYNVGPRKITRLFEKKNPQCRLSYENRKKMVAMRNDGEKVPKIAKTFSVSDVTVYKWTNI